MLAKLRWQIAELKDKVAQLERENAELVADYNRRTNMLNDKLQGLQKLKSDVTRLLANS